MVKCDGYEDSTVSVSINKKYEIVLNVAADSVLNNNSWETIGKISSRGKASQYWSIGDTKTVTVSSVKVGGVKISSFTSDAFIIGFNQEYQGGYLTTFQIGKQSGVPLCMITSGAGYGHGSAYSSNLDGDVTLATGGWASNLIRTSLDSVYSALPSVLQSVIKSVRKYTDNGRYTGSVISRPKDVTATNDKCFIPSAYEYAGETNVGNEAEKEYQRYYSYYASGNSKVKYRYDRTTKATPHWTRSRSLKNNYKAIIVVGESLAASDSGLEYGFAPCFCV